jgi:hypothetical protein
VVLVFDQFEELLTVAPLAVAEKEAFFTAVGQALEAGSYWALFIVREDHLGAFAPYRDRIPTQLSNTFRLDLLGLEGAREAAEQPRWPAAALPGGRPSWSATCRPCRCSRPTAASSPSRGCTSSRCSCRWSAAGCGTRCRTDDLGHRSRRTSTDLRERVDGARRLLRRRGARDRRRRRGGRASAAASGSDAS